MDTRARHHLFVLVLTLLVTACTVPDEPTISLYLTIQRGDIDQLERHLHWGTPVDQALPNGRYPLHEVAARGRVVMLKMLLRQGVRIDPRDPDGQTPLDLAILNGRTQAATVLIRAGATFDPSQLLLEATRRNISDRDVVRFLERHGADVDVRDARGNTPLLIAAAHGNHRLAHYLIEFGADINTRNAAGESALDITRQSGLPELEKFLLANGAIDSKP